MPLVILAIGAVLIISAWRNTYGALFTALGQDVPGFLKWALAIVCIGLIGYIPKLEPISRMLLALVAVVLVLENYSKLFSGFTTLSSSTPAATTGSTQVATQYASATGQTAPTTEATSITSGTSSNTAAATAVGSAGMATTTGATTTSTTGGTTTTSPYDPSTFLAGFEHGFGGGLSGVVS